MPKQIVRSQTKRSEIATIRRGIFDMQELRNKFIPPNQVHPSVIHFDATIATAKVLLGHLESETLDVVTFKDAIEMHGLLQTGMYTEEQILEFYGVYAGRSIDYYYTDVYRVPQTLELMNERDAS